MLVEATRLDARGSGRSQERVGWRKVAERLFEYGDFTLQGVVSAVSHGTGADVFVGADLVGGGTGLLEERASFHCGFVEGGEFQPVLAAGQESEHGSRRTDLEAGEAVVDEADPVTPLGELAFIDQVDSRLALQAHDVGDLAA